MEACDSLCTCMKYFRPITLFIDSEILNSKANMKENHVNHYSSQTISQTTKLGHSLKNQHQQCNDEHT